MTPQDIASALNIPLQGVAANWPQVLSALVQEKINTHAVRVATAATILTEVGAGFAPIHEYGDTAYFTRMYEGRADLGNSQPGDGARFAGAGYLQLTGRANYRTYGQRLGLDLEGNPDLALDPHVAALVLALYFVDRGIPAMAAAGNWLGVRRAVNGGTNGWDTFIGAVNRLSTIADPDGHPVTTVAVAVPLHNAASASAPPAVDAAHHPVHLAVGTRVVFTPDPRTRQEVTPQMAHVVVGSGPVHGWILRSALTTKYEP